jgi:hypothetical protein
MQVDGDYFDPSLYRTPVAHSKFSEADAAVVRSLHQHPLPPTASTLPLCATHSSAVDPSSAWFTFVPASTRTPTPLSLLMLI